MERSKRTQLKHAGWRIGSTSDFLELNEPESALIEVELALGVRRRKARERCKLPMVGRPNGKRATRGA
jgi:hypothetical protein